MATDLLDEASQRLALALLRETLWRMQDGRLPVPADDGGEPLEDRVAAAQGRCRGRAERMYELYREAPLARALADRLGLDRLDLDLLLLAAACQHEPGLAQALTTLRPPNVEAPLHGDLLASLASLDRGEHGRLLARLEPTAPLATWMLIELGVGSTRPAPLGSRAVSVPDRIALLLAGETAGDAGSRLVARPVQHRFEPRVDSAAFARALAPLTHGDGSPLAIALVASPASDRPRFAAAIGDRLGRPVIAVDLDLAADDVATLDRQLRAVARDARIDDALLLVTGLERMPPEQRPRKLAAAERALDLVGWREPILAAVDDPQLLRDLDRDIAAVELPIPKAEARAGLLRTALSEAGRDQLPSRLTDDQVDATARLYPLPPGAIEAAARAAVRSARARIATDDDARLDEGDLLAAVRAQLEHRMSSLADPIRQRLSFDDMVLEPETLARLREIIIYVKEAATVYDRWGFSSRAASRGVSALFGGPPGTGKTMAATVIASELGLELFRIDLSRVVSKYIGETESNLERVFKEATASRAVLLFDEADALFGKRTDIKSSTDRYANMEINYLLQRVEDFDGISILTTNKEKSMDDAFKRRIQFRLQFEPPDDAMRATLWRKLIPTSADLADDVDFTELGSRFDMPGGNIRNAALRAAFLSASRDHAIDMATLVEAASRELEQMGRVMTSGRGSSL